MVGTPEFSASAARDRVQMNGRYFGSMITAILGAPGSGKSTIAPALAGLLPGHVVLNWDAFMGPAAALAGREIPESPETWSAYRDLVHAVICSVAHLPVVMLGVCTPDELKGWPIDAWALLDCTDQERQRRLGQHADPQRLAEGIRDGREYRQLGLPVIDTTGRAPATVASELAALIQSLHQSQQS
jgi:energy-coupling factor transporter ATP-binding protein EcfA2